MGFLDNAHGFDVPLHDPATGELLEDREHAHDDELLDSDPPQESVDDAAQQIALFASGGAALNSATFVHDLRLALNARIDELYAAKAAQRRQRLSPTSGDVQPPTTSDVQPELLLLSDMHSTLTGVGRAFADAAKSTTQIASDVVLDVKHERAETIEQQGGTASVRVGGHQGSVKVTTTQATKPFAETDQIVDVLIADLLADVDVTGIERPDEHVSLYAKGARDAIAGLLGLVSPLSWKTSALDVWQRALQTRNEEALASRLAAAYGRRPVGSLNTKIERFDDPAPVAADVDSD